MRQTRLYLKKVVLTDVEDLRRPSTSLVAAPCTFLVEFISAVLVGEITGSMQELGSIILTALMLASERRMKLLPIEI